MTHECKSTLLKFPLSGVSTRSVTHAPLQALFDFNRHAQLEVKNRILKRVNDERCLWRKILGGHRSQTSWPWKDESIESQGHSVLEHTSPTIQYEATSAL